MVGVENNIDDYIFLFLQKMICIEWCESSEILAFETLAFGFSGEERKERDCRIASPDVDHTPTIALTRLRPPLYLAEEWARRVLARSWLRFTIT